MKTNLPIFLNLDRTEQKATIESLIFAANADEILSAKNIINIIISSDSNPNISENKAKFFDNFFEIDYQIKINILNDCKFF